MSIATAPLLHARLVELDQPDATDEDVTEKILASPETLDELRDLVAPAVFDYVRNRRRNRAHIRERAAMTPRPAAGEDVSRIDQMRVLAREMFVYKIGEPRVSWALATVDQHESRIKMLRAFAKGASDSADDHADVVRLLRVEKAANLAEIWARQNGTPS